MTLPPAASLHQPARSFYSHWQQVNDWLVRHQELWQPAPFMEPEPAWCERYPELAHWLGTLTVDACEAFEENLAAFAVEAARFVPNLADYSALVELPELSPPDSGPRSALPELQAVDMPGRKRLQAGAFAAAVLPLQQPVLDWCCGKGHLARTLAARGAARVRGFEWNDELVQDGNRLARHYGDPVQLHHQDVMADSLNWPAGVHGVALHACGDLHRQLLKRGAAAGTPRLSFSPCCYHLTAQEPYQPLAQGSRNHAPALRPGRNTLRLAVQETVTAPARVREQTARVTAWRLGFDALQRHLRAADSYLPVPSHPPSLNNGDFEGFCRWAAGKKQLDLPDNLDWQHWSTRGEQRALQVQRHELLRHLFRRPLELWMVLDYAVFLEEQGYRVRLGRFCARELTPRNLLVDAVRVE